MSKKIFLSQENVVQQNDVIYTAQWKYWNGKYELNLWIKESCTDRARARNNNDTKRNRLYAHTRWFRVESGAWLKWFEAQSMQRNAYPTFSRCEWGCGDFFTAFNRTRSPARVLQKYPQLITPPIFCAQSFYMFTLIRMRRAEHTHTHSRSHMPQTTRRRSGRRPTHVPTETIATRPVNKHHNNCRSIDMLWHSERFPLKWKSVSLAIGCRHVIFTYIQQTNQHARTHTKNIGLQKQNRGKWK